uniref:Aspartyl/glutamyl-tRNA(Asn/Gln) amidotransferase subunit B n=1 Tax=Schlesneria paludicola TaxID=360056 RepID=A0A7C4QTC6_9PLAN
MFDVIIGLEVHVQLLTQTKIFCGCSTAFRPDQPNVQTCPVCLGLPGALPVLNREALRLAMKTALALHCEIAPFTKWDRKQYFYPDLPKGYQISQYDLPFSRNGWLEIEVPPAGEGGSSQTGQPTIRRVGIIRAHLEEDAGKNLHDESGRGRDSFVDLNRAGTPLVEIVTQPDLRSAAEARQFLQELHLLLTWLKVSDCNMQEGSLRCDANVNLHVARGDGTKVATPIVEIKNLNSFRFTEQAITYEVQRQWDAFQRTGQTIRDAPKSTRGFDPDRGLTYPLREKEEAADYRYFPDPDLVPVTISAAELEAMRGEMGETPGERRRRYEREFGLSAYDADVLIHQGAAVCDYFETVSQACGDAKQAANWVTQDVLRELKDRRQAIEAFPVSAGVLSVLLKKVRQKQITVKSAREIFTELLADCDAHPDAAVRMSEADQLARIEALITERGLALVQDDATLLAAVTAVIERNPKAVEDFRGGKQAAIGALIGQVMKQVKGADAQVVRQLLSERLQKM